MTDKVCKEHPEAGVIMVANPPDAKHHGTWRCVKCDRWLTHAKKPSTTQELESRQKFIRSIIMHENIREISEADLIRLLNIYGATHLNLVQEKEYRKYQERFPLISH